MGCSDGHQSSLQTKARLKKPSFHRSRDTAETVKSSANKQRASESATVDQPRQTAHRHGCTRRPDAK
eukprot:scaffold254374_cov28-Tisochrysis_lutea.AAC.1